MQKVTKELQDVVKKNKQLKAVYFDENGNHYFAKHLIEVHETDESGYSTKVTKVEALPGAKKSVVKIIIDPKKQKVIDKYVNTDYVPVHDTMTREEILKATPVYRAFSDEKKIEILRQAASIAKENGFEDLMKQLKSTK